MKHFNQAILEVDEADDQVQMMAFQAGLTTKDFIFQLAKTLPTIITDLLFKAQKYMNQEDALMAEGVDGKRKMEEIDKLRHKKKEKKDHRKNDSIHDYTRSSSIPKEELISSNHSTANSYLVHGIKNE